MIEPVSFLADATARRAALKAQIAELRGPGREPPQWPPFVDHTGRIIGAQPALTPEYPALAKLVRRLYAPQDAAAPGGNSLCAYYNQATNWQPTRGLFGIFDAP